MSKTQWITAWIIAALLLPIASAQAVTLKLATLLPDGSLQMVELRKAAAEIKDKTEGRVIFKYYPGGTMGNDKAILRKIRVGQLHGGALTGGGLSGLYTDNQIYNLPFIFNSYEEVDFVRNQMDKVIMDGLEQNGFLTFGLIEGGFAYIFSQKPIRKVEDLHGQKVWGPEGDTIARTVFEGMGISPIPLPLTDVMTGLQTGLINTVGTSPVGAITLQWFTKVKYMTDIPLLYFYGTIAVSTKSFAKITPEDQAIVKEIMGRVVSKLDKQSRVENQKARDALAQQGIQFVSPTPEELVKWRTIAEQAIISLGEKNVYSEPMKKMIDSYLDQYRQGQAQ